MATRDEMLQESTFKDECEGVGRRAFYTLTENRLSADKTVPLAIAAPIETLHDNELGGRRDVRRDGMTDAHRVYLRFRPRPSLAVTLRTVSQTMCRRFDSCRAPCLTSPFASRRRGFRHSARSPGAAATGSASRRRARRDRDCRSPVGRGRGVSRPPGGGSTRRSPRPARSVRSLFRCPQAWPSRPCWQADTSSGRDRRRHAGAGPMATRAGGVQSGHDDFPPDLTQGQYYCGNK
jgi:hypothetical protein